jgi:hypothetical protein
VSEQRLIRTQKSGQVRSADGPTRNIARLTDGPEVPRPDGISSAEQPRSAVGRLPPVEIGLVVLPNNDDAMRVLNILEDISNTMVRDDRSMPATGTDDERASSVAQDCAAPALPGSKAAS